jgi:glyoxylate/hydroxypyruvate reductase A
VRILLYTPSSKMLPEWRSALARALPEGEVRSWEPGLAWRADYAALWYPAAEVLAGQTGLKAIFNLGAGVEALLNRVALPPGVPIIRLEDAGMARQMAEYVTWAVLRYFRRLDAYAAQQSRAEWKLLRPLRHAEFPVGVMGMGVLGTHVARALARLGFPVLGWSRGKKQVDGVRPFAGPPELDAFLAGSRVLVCMLPLTAATEGILNRRTLFKLPQGSYVINVARGGLVVDEDLLAALDAGHVAGATLDVFHEEPLPAAHPYWRHPKVLITPHASAITLIDESAAQVAAKIRRLERGEPVTGVVDLARGY